MLDLYWLKVETGLMSSISLLPGRDNILDIYWTNVGIMLDIYWICFGHMLDKSRNRADVLVPVFCLAETTYWTYIGEMLVSC